MNESVVAHRLIASFYGGRRRVVEVWKVEVEDKGTADATVNSHAREDRTPSPQEKIRS